MHRLRRRFAEHPIGAFLVLAVVVLGGIGGAIGGLEKVSDLVNPGEPPPVRFDADDLNTAAIPRFGFAFSYPSLWKRDDPYNADGATFVSDDPTVRVTAFGRHAVVGPPPSQERLDYLVEQAAGETGTIVDEPTLQRVPGTAARGGGDVPGLRTVVRVPATEDQPELMRMVLISTIGDQDVEIHCQAPTEDFERWEPACTQLINSLTFER